MRKLYSFALLLVAAVFCSTAYGYTGKEDVTSWLTNADFSADATASRLVRTYAKDMTDNGAGAGGAELYGMQSVTGWTASNPTDNIKHTDADARDAKAAGVFPIYDPDTFDELDESELVGLGGSYYCKGNQATDKALGITCVWGGNGNTPIYSQDLTLPAGYYILVFNVCNSAGTASINNNEIGFVAGDKKFMSDKTSYPVGEWTSDTVFISLDAEAAGQVTLGFNAGSVGSGSAPHLFFESVKLFTVDEAEVLAEEIAAAKAELLELINLGKVYQVDTSASETVYNNPSATLAEVQEAIENQKAINETGITDLSPYFIINSHFDLDEPVEGGICTYDYDMSKNNVNFFGSQPLTGWEALNVSDNTVGANNRKENGRASGVYAIGSGAWIGGTNFVVPTVMSDGKSEGKVLGFLTCWSQTVQYTQAVTLPAGEYTLTLSYYNVGGTSAIGKNLIGFVTDGGTEYLSTKTTFPMNQWTKDEIKFTLDDETTGYFTLGYTATNSGSGAMPHFFTDGISLLYVGNVDAATLALNSAIKGAELLLSDNFYTELKTQLQDAIDAGKAVVEGTDTEAKQAAYETLSALVTATKANIAAYKKLDEFYNEGGALYEAIVKYDEEHYPDLAQQLGLIADGAMEALMDYNWDTETIENTISSLPEVIKTGVQTAWDNAVQNGTIYDGDGIDISVLFEGIGENGDFSGWTTTNGSIGVQFNVAEVYEGTPFTASRTLESLPTGKYTVATQGFYRFASNDVNYDDYQSTDLHSYVFAGAAKAELPNVASVTFDSKDAFAGLAETSTGSGIYVINNREGASQVFADALYGPQFVASSATTLTKTEDLKFGVCADEMQSKSWTTWYQFSIYYNGVTNADLYDELTSQIAALAEQQTGFETYLEDNQETITSPMSDDADDADELVAQVIDDASDVADTYDDASGEFDGYTPEQIKQYINKVKETSAYLDSIRNLVKENVAAVDSCLAARNQLDETLNDASLSPSAAAVAEAETLLEEDATDDVIANMTTEEVRALKARIEEATGALKIPDDMQNASDEEPYDATSLIVNNSFEGEDGGGSTDGWTWNSKATGDTGARDLSNATYAYTSAYGEEVGNYTFNTWNGSAPADGFYLAQTITAVPAGTYELKALLAADEGSVISLTVNGDGKTYTLATPKEEATEADIIFTLADKGDIEIRVSSGSWFKADYFRLTYFGADSQKTPDVTEIDEIAVSGVEITGIFNPAGAQIPALQPGLNFIKYADGTVVKLFKK